MTFQVYADGKLTYDSGLITHETEPKPVTADITAAHLVELIVTDAGDDNTNDHADWANARMTCTA